MAEDSVTSSAETNGEAEKAAEPETAPVSPVLQRLQQQWGDTLLAVHSYRGDDTAEVKPEAIVEVCRFCRDDDALAFDYLMDLAGVDYLRYDDGPRLGVVYHLYSLRHNHRLRLRVRVDEGQPVPSVTDVWPVANWFEREVYDMFGIEFSGHPDLRRILMYDGFEGHPLRKDYPVNKRQPLIGPRN